MKRRNGLEIIFFDLEGTILTKVTDDLFLKDIAPSVWARISHLMGPDALAEEKATQERWLRSGYKNYVEWMEDTARIHRKYGLTREVFERAIESVGYHTGAEETFAELLPVLAERELKNLHKVSGIAYKEKGEILKTENRPFIKDLDSLPFPAWDLVPFQKYTKYMNYGHPSRYDYSMSIFTSRACPFKCIYCHRFFGTKFRPRSAENVLEEIEILYKYYKVREIHILDDNFNLDLHRAKQICNGIISRNLNISICLHNGIRTDYMDKELIDLLVEAGLTRICFAIETASPRLQKLIRKNQDLEKTRKLIEYTSKKRVITHCYFMIGFPTETEEEIKATINYACSLSLNTADFFRPIPFRGTELSKLVGEKLLPGPFDDFRYSYDSTDINLSEVSNEKIQYLQKYGFLKFHFNPYRINRFMQIYIPFYKFRLFRFFINFLRRKLTLESARIMESFKRN